MCKKWLTFPLVALFFVLASVRVSADTLKDYRSGTGGNIGRQAYTVRSKPVYSYLTVCDDGSLLRFEAPQTGDSYDNRYHVETYDAGYNLLDSRRVDVELPIFGGFYSATDAYYLVTGQTNYDESDTVEVMRVTKYDKNWKRLSSTALRAADTYIPFDAGSLRFTEYNGILFIRTAHEMYDKGDGLHHQSNFTVTYEMATGAIDRYVFGQTDPLGYVSHSFNQFLAFDGSRYVAVDHGDAYPRSVVLRMGSIPAFGYHGWNGYDTAVNVIDIPGSIGNNWTGVTVGGLAVSDSAYLVAGSMVNNLEDYSEYSSAKNVYVASVSKSTKAVTLRKMTQYTDEQGGVDTPQLVRIGQNRFLLLYQKKDQRDKVFYALLDGSGSQVGKTYEMEGALSDCLPVVAGGKLVWYTWSGYGVTFYDIDVNNVSTHHAQTLYKGKKYTPPHTAETGTRVESGNLGDTVKYELYDNGNLYIFGQGSASSAEKDFTGDTRIKKVTVELSVTSLPSSLFKDCTNLRSVTLADTLTTLYSGVFSGCTGLTSVTVPDSVTSVGEKAFSGCTGLKSVKLSRSLTSVSYYMFYGCTGLTSVTVPDSVTSIGSRAFSGCTGLQTVTLSQSLTSVGMYVFEDCTALTAIVFPDSLTTLGYETLGGCTSLTSVTLPAKLTAVPDSLFSGCTALKTVTIPGTVTSIGSYAFWNCAGLTKLTIPGKVTSVEAYAFYGCSSLTEMKIPDSVTTLGKGIFFNCSSLTGVTLPAGLTSIPDSMFEGCGSLTRLRVPDGVTSIVRYAFWGCGGMTEIILPKSLTSVEQYAFSYNNALQTVRYTGTQSQWNTLKSDGIDQTGNSALLNVSNLVCNYNPDAVASVAIKTQPTRLTYDAGDAFDPTGMKLSVTTVSGTVKDVTSGFTCTPSQLNTEGQQKITVTYGGKSAALTVTVLPKNKTVTAVSIKTYPAKMTYTVGETFQSKGLVLKVTYEGGLTAEVSSGFNCAPTAAFTAEGQQKVTVSYGGKEARLYVGVNPKGKTVSYVNIKKKPSKLVYHIGDTFQPSGMVLLIGYSDKSTKEVISAYTYTPTGKLTSEGQQRVAVTYAGVSTGFNIAVHPKGKTVTGVGFKTYPAKMLYKIGETFAPKGTVLKITYSDGSTAEKSAGFTYTPTGAFAAEGQQKVTVTYAGVSAGFYVGVNPKNKTVSSVGFKSYPDRKTYKVSDTFQPSGMVLKITYSDGSTAEKSSGYTYTPSGKLTAEGQQRVEVTYAGQKARFYIAVNPKNKTVSSVGFKSYPDKKVYKAGESFQPSGMVLKITYSDGSTAEKSSGYTYTPSGKLTTEGQQKITVTYAGKTAGLYVGVNPATKSVTSVGIAKKPSKLNYHINENFQPAGMVLKITYSDGSTKEVTSGYTYTPSGKLTSEGQQRIAVTYAGKSVGFNIAVHPVGKTVKSAAVKTLPIKRTYQKGETFNPAGLVLTVTYSDGTTAQKSAGFTYTPTGKMNTAGQQAVVITYAGKNVSFNVTVK